MQGITFQKGMGRSAYICKSKKCYSDSKIKKKLQKALKTSLETEFIDIFEQETYEEETFSDSDQLETVQDGEVTAKEERKR